MFMVLVFLKPIFFGANGFLTIKVSQFYKNQMCMIENAVVTTDKVFALFFTTFFSY